jgi:uncharacterized membrane protein YkvA (DUF1232 family)
VAHIDTFKAWAETIRQDIEAFSTLLESKSADQASRKLAGAALLYMVSRMDLIPDWNEGIGVIDDVMVLRVCAQLSHGHTRGDLSATAEASLERMANQADAILQFLGGPLYDKLRKDLKVELDDEIKKTVPIVINDPVDAELRLKAYLNHKLH